MWKYTPEKFRRVGVVKVQQLDFMALFRMVCLQKVQQYDNMAILQVNFNKMNLKSYLRLDSGAEKRLEFVRIMYQKTHQKKISVSGLLRVLIDEKYEAISSKISVASQTVL